MHLQSSKICCLILAMSVMAGGLGCGGGASSSSTTKTSENPVISGKDQVKERLQAVASSGSGGSAVGGIREALLELKKTESALADQLLSDLVRLEQTEDAEAIKKIASDMLAKL